MHGKYRTTNIDLYLLEFRRLRSLIKEQIKAAYNEYITDIQTSIVDDSARFWSFVNSKNRTSRIPGEMHLGDQRLCKPQNIVNSFGEFFSSVYIQSIPTDHHQPVNNVINEYIPILQPITGQDIMDASKRLKNKMTSGPDQVPSFIVKDCIGAFLKPLLIIFNLCTTMSTVPKLWKRAKVCPIYKSGRRNQIDNYRPISILCNFSKILETILYRRIYMSLRTNIAFEQHGFVNNRSTITNLSCLTQQVSRVLDNQGQVDVVYTDFSKAFDRIDHVVLLRKLRGYGFDASALAFFESYLTDRRQFVCYNGYMSCEYVSTSGVPQGSNLGPLLFLLFINDLNEIIQCGRLLFADDLKIFLQIKSLLDCIRLQQQLDLVQSWCESNRLNLNATKCRVMSYNRKQRPILYPYSVVGEELERPGSLKDLGVIFDPMLTFVEHINKVVLEAGRILGFVVRNCRNFDDSRVFKTLFFSYVRSKLEYASLIWNPYYACHVNNIERIQKRFLKYLTFKLDGVYPERGIEYNALLNRYNFTTLERRRIITSLIFLFKLLRGGIDCPDLLNQINFFVPRLNTRQHLTFLCERARTNVMVKSPLNFMCSNFNVMCGNCDIFFCSLGELRRIVELD